MAFTSAVTASGKTVFGNKRRVIGTYTNTGGSTGGDVTTNLSSVETFTLQTKGSAIVASAPVVNETFPLVNSTGAVTIVTNADEVGYWEATGI